MGVERASKRREPHLHLNPLFIAGYLLFTAPTFYYPTIITSFILVGYIVVEQQICSFSLVIVCVFSIELIRKLSLSFPLLEVSRRKLLC